MSYPVRNEVQVEHQEGSQLHSESSEEKQHGSVASRRRKDVLSLTGSKEVALWIKVRPFLSGASAPLQEKQNHTVSGAVRLIL